MGKKPNYKAKILLNIVDRLEPIGSAQWMEVADKYKVDSGEGDLRDWQDLKRYFVEKLCDKNKKPTGESAPKPQVARAQAIYEKILRKEGCGIYGDEASSEDEFEDEDEDDDDEEETDGVGTEPSQSTEEVPLLGSGGKVAGSKRKATHPASATKTSNSRHNARASAKGLINTLTNSLDGLNTASMMQMMMQQQQQQTAMMMQMMQQQQQQMMQILLARKDRGDMPSSASSVISEGNAFDFSDVDKI